MQSEDQELPDLTKVPVDERDKVWFETYYQGDNMPQLTVRAVVMGMALGTVLSLTNLYIGLKTGWGLGVAITACIMSYAIWTVFLRLGLVKTPMSILENNCMQSTASSAGYSTGGTMVSCIGAYVIVNQAQVPLGVLFWWTAFLALLGVSIAVPMKRQMINQEQLPFPSGIAAAETLRSLHASGQEALLKARALFAALFAGGVIKFLVEGTAWVSERFASMSWVSAITVPGGWDLPFSINGKPAAKFGLTLPIDPLMVAAGAIVGLRTSVSIAVGAITLYGILGPWLDSSGVLADMKALGAIKTADVTQGNIRAWGLWTGSAMMVTAGLTSFAFQWRSIARALGGLGALFGGGKAKGDDPLSDIEVPNSWFVGGTLVSGIGCIWIMQSEWHVPWYLGIVAVLLAFVLSLVACRATGETDTTPIGAMGKVTQLTYGILLPPKKLEAIVARGNLPAGMDAPHLAMTANLMAAGVTAGAAGSAADLLTDLKSGYLLGANPRQQTIAQSWGIIAGTFATVFAWSFLFVRSPADLQSEKFPAPAATVWASVAELLSKGLETMHPTIIWGMAIGAALGVIITVLERVLPAKLAKWLPSPTGLGLAFVIYFIDAIAFLIGAVLAALFKTANEKQAETYTVPVAAGIIAGESLMGAAIVAAQVIDGIVGG